MAMLPLYDAHQHFQFDELAPHRTAIAAALRAIGVKGAVVNGSCEQDWPVVTTLAQQHDWIIPSYGLHPWDCGNRSPAWQTALRTQLEAHPLAHVGEIGLDRWMIDSVKPGDPRLAGLRIAPMAEQHEAFTWQLALAAELNRVASIHCLQAFGPLLEDLIKTPRPARGFLLHAYSGPAEMIGPFAALGAYFSFNGNFLKHKSGSRSPGGYSRLQDWKLIPADRLLVETDAPAMPFPKEWTVHQLPVGPHGEKLNHPANLEVAYAALSSLRDTPIEALVTQVEKNFQRLFGRE
jgi:TatD DNase family protein